VIELAVRMHGNHGSDILGSPAGMEHERRDGIRWWERSITSTFERIRSIGWRTANLILTTGDFRDREDLVVNWESVFKLPSTWNSVFCYAEYGPPGPEHDSFDRLLSGLSDSTTRAVYETKFVEKKTHMRYFSMHAHVPELASCLSAPGSLMPLSFAYAYREGLDSCSVVSNMDVLVARVPGYDSFPEHRLYLVRRGVKMYVTYDPLFLLLGPLCSSRFVTFTARPVVSERLRVLCDRITPLSETVDGDTILRLIHGPAYVSRLPFSKAVFTQAEMDDLLSILGGVDPTQDDGE